MLEGSPLGDIFTCFPASGAEAMKKMDCFKAHSPRFSGIESKNWTMVAYLGGNVTVWYCRKKDKEFT